MNLSNIKDNNGLPLFSKIVIKSIEKNTDQIITNLNEDFQKLEKNMITEKSNFYNLCIYEREKIEYDLGFYWGVISHLTSVKNNNEL